MILRTIISGQTVHGSQNKRIVHPYTGASPDSVEYAGDIRIERFLNTVDIHAFRRRLVSAADSMSRYLKEHKPEITAIAANETGSPIRYQADDLDAARMFLQKLDILETMLPKMYLLEPKGNILLILPANEPIITSTILTFSSLFIGNVVFVKPSSKAPTYSSMLVRELSKLLALKERVHFLLADSAEVERLMRNKTFDFVLSFGSRSTNRKLATICAEAEVEFLQESEGNDWGYVDKDYSPIEEISRLIVDSFVRHNGQMCNAMRGVMAHSSIYDALVDRIKEQISTLTVGSPILSGTNVGALIAGTETRAGLVIKEMAAKAEEVWNFTAQGGVVSPTLVLNPEDGSPICRESIFAPVLWIKKVGGSSEAISFLKEQNLHGLGFSVFSKDEKVINECIRDIKVGRINVNKHPLETGLFDPLGGIRLSGRGGPSFWIEKVANRKFINDGRQS